jgi:hypothetical protein
MLISGIVNSKLSGSTYQSVEATVSRSVPPRYVIWNLSKIRSVETIRILVKWAVSYSSETYEDVMQKSPG